MKTLRTHLARVVSVALGVALLGMSHTASAATLSLAASSLNVSAGNIVTATVVVNTAGAAINNAEGVVQFPTDMLEALSVDTSSSIFSLWIGTPSFSNTAGTVSFNGGVPSPGYTGTNGTILSISFRAKQTGTATLSLANAAVRANDGLGTDVLSTKNSATITIGSAAPAKPAPVAAPTTPRSNAAALPPPTVSSPTDPDQNAWYQSGNATLQWSLPDDATMVQTLLGSHPDSIPSVSYTPPITSKDVTAMPDGVWYFHVRYKTPDGWSATAHYRLQVDSAAPKNLVVTTSTNTYGQVSVSMHATDALSGIDHYMLQVDQSPPTIVQPDTSGGATSTLPALASGNHALAVSAVDHAGNSVQTTQTVAISVPLAINLTSYPTSVKVGQRITVAGQTSYPNAIVAVSLTSSGTNIATYQVHTDASGIFRFTSDPTTDSGIAILWATLLNQDGSTAASSEKVSIAIEKPLLIQIGSYSTELLSVVVPTVALLLCLLFLLYFGWHKFFHLRRHVRKDLEAARTRIHQALKQLSDDATREVAALEKTTKHRKLSASENNAVDEVRATINRVDEYIQKTIDRIEDMDL